jgi:SAM-dependent methyltransferase
MATTETCPCPKRLSWLDNHAICGFDRHDLEGSKRYLSKLRPRGRMRRWNFSGGEYDSGHPNRYYGVRSTAFEALYQARGYVHEDMGVYLDAGCGDSADADIALVSGYSKAYGIDLYRPMVHLSDADYKGWFAKSRVRLTYKFILGDICEELPITKGTVDAISSNYVIPLMCQADRLSFYSQAYRLLRPGGYFVIAADVLSSGYNHIERQRGWDDNIFRIQKEVTRLRRAGFKLMSKGSNYLVARKSSQARS